MRAVTAVGVLLGTLGMVPLQRAAMPDPGTAMGTPLLLDVAGTGVALTAVRQSQVHFDLDGDGVLERIAWVVAAGRRTNAWLAWDRNGNGTVDGGRELFGNQHGAANGFLELALLDSNHDGVVDPQDAGFGRLLLWQDFNHNGISEPGELHPLAAHGVAGLVTAYAEDGAEDGQGNGLYQHGVFIRANGSRGVMVDVWLQMDKREEMGALL